MISTVCNEALQSAQTMVVLLLITIFITYKGLQNQSLESGHRMQPFPTAAAMISFFIVTYCPGTGTVIYAACAITYRRRSDIT